MIAGGWTIDRDAPASVRLVGDFVNSVEWQVDEEAWETGADLASWLHDHAALEVSGLTDADLALARRVREGLRSVLLSHAGHDPLAGAVDDLNRALDRVGLLMRFDASGAAELVPDGRSPLAAALGRVLAAVDRARVDGSWQRLKACSRDSCRWAYWDDSRNQSGRWCTMAGCGNYLKGRRRRDGSDDAEVIASGQRERRATLVDVAARAGVSIKTVSNVVNEQPHVAVPTRSRVLDAIRELDYRPNLAARALRIGATFTAGSR